MCPQDKSGRGRRPYKRKPAGHGPTPRNSAPPQLLLPASQRTAGRSGPLVAAPLLQPLEHSSQAPPRPRRSTHPPVKQQVRSRRTVRGPAVLVANAAAADPTLEDGSLTCRARTRQRKPPTLPRQQRHIHSHQRQQSGPSGVQGHDLLDALVGVGGHLRNNNHKHPSTWSASGSKQHGSRVCHLTCKHKD